MVDTATVRRSGSWGLVRRAASTAKTGLTIAAVSAVAIGRSSPTASGPLVWAGIGHCTSVDQRPTACRYRVSWSERSVIGVDHAARPCSTSRA
jgi:hypothetical protein